MRVNPFTLRLARTRLVKFGSLVVPGYSERVWWYHEQIAEALEGALRWVRFKGKKGGYARVAISMPPQHGKSLHGTELFPDFALGQDPDLRIIAASNGATLAKKGIDHARQFMSHENYRRAFSTRFGRVEEFAAESSRRTRVLEVESSSQFFRTIKPADPESSHMVPGDGYYLAQGLGGSITGWGYDIGIGDDFIKNAEQALSQRYQEKLWEFYTSTFATRQRAEHSVQIYIGTRWTSPDFADGLVEYWQAQDTEASPVPIKVLKFPALADGETELSDDDPRRDEAFIERYGAGLDNPKHRTAAYYFRERESLMTRTPWVWFGMYQQAPRMSGAKFFQPEEWGYYDASHEDVLRRCAYLDFSIDANLSETGQSFAVITVAAVLEVGRGLPNDEGVHFFLVDEARGHWDYQKLEAEFVRLRKKWEAAYPAAAANGSVWVENKALGPTLLSKFRDVYPLVAVPKAKAKTVCYQLASPVVSQRRVWLPKGTWGQDPTFPGDPLVTDAWVGSGNDKGSWVHELKSHPDRPDDRRDALAQLIICRTPWLGIDLLTAS